MTRDNINPIGIIPHYNHSDTIAKVAEQLLAMGLPVLIVDDGSSASHLAVLRQLERTPNLHVHYCAKNGGKGTAMKTGFRWAKQQGFSHAIQVDADGQHQLSDSLTMLEQSRQNPTALICGRPIYGDDAPKSRLYGRKITNFWNAIHTHSLDIIDGMCGFRLYPLESTVQLVDSERIGDRMDFDIEILIKAHWHQIPLIWVSTPIKYITNGVSHFRVFADNWQISKMHSRLFWGMVWRVFSRKPL